MALGVCFITTVFTLTLVYLTPLSFLEEEYHFKQWMLQHNRVYDDLDEFYLRLQIFTENKRTIDHHNAGNHSFTMGLNQFSDMTFEEFRKLFLLTEPQNCSATKGGHVVSKGGLYPESVDWRTKGNFVTPVKNQGHCGSCWTFSTTGCLESVTAITTGKLLSLSEQQLIDCAKDFNNHGCMGGLPSQAFEYIKYSKGLMAEEDYPYKGYDDSCQFKPKLAAAFVLDVVNITSYDEKAMVDAVARLNPVSFAFEVTHDFIYYKEGVYTRFVGFSAVASLSVPICFHIGVGPECTQCESTAEKVNHAVLAVGYGADENDTPYWIVKNSWGTAWGIDGYFLIERGKNMCGLAACSSYPIPKV